MHTVQKAQESPVQNIGAPGLTRPERKTAQALRQRSPLNHPERLPRPRRNHGGTAVGGKSSLVW